jgi:alginate O-acetyltransferase complex protein AlgI
MLFSSITFLYYFLPIVLILYIVTPTKLKNLVLLVASITFYAWGEPAYCILMIALVTQSYLFARAIEKELGTRKAKVLMIASVVLCLGCLAYFKYSNFFIENVNSMFHVSIPVLQIALPLGISFYTFQVLSYVVDVYKGVVPANKSFINLLTYAILFPQLIAGPIVRYMDVENQLINRKHEITVIYSGIRRFVVGLAKKVLIANQLGELVNHFQESKEQSVLFYWIFGIAYTLQIYYDFSGYSDMAIGLGRMFGFHFMENFNYPYIAKSITEFWRRWHISLSTWFRDYVYIPLGGNRVSKRRQIFNLFLVWILTGFWHGAAWNFIVWGFLYFVLLSLEKFILNKVIHSIPPILSHVYVMLAVILGFVIFHASSLNQALHDIGNMFGFYGLSFTSLETNYYILSYGIILILAVIGSMPFIKKIYELLLGVKSMNWMIAFLEPVILCIIILVITGYLVDGSFNPFLYFRF